MNIFSITSLCCAITCLILALIALIFKKTKLHLLLIFFNVAVTLWGFGSFLAGVATSEPKALIGWQIAHLGGFFIGTFFYHLVCVFCEIRRRHLIYFAYCQAIFFNLLSFGTHLVFNKTRHIFGIYYNDATIALTLGVVAYLSLVILSYYELVKFIKHSTGHKRTQALYIMFGFMCGFIGGTSTFLPEFKIDIVYPFGNIGIALYCVIVTYAILRHHLLDVDVIIKKTLVFAGLLTSVLVIFIIPTLLVQEYIFRNAGFGGRLFGLIISGIIILTFMKRIEKILVDATDRYLFQKKYDYNQVWRAFIDEVITLLDLGKIIDKTLELLKKTLHPERAAIFLSDARGDLSLEGSYDCPVDITLSTDSLIPVYLKEKRSVISAEVDNHNHISNGIREEMKRLGMVLVVPLILRDELIGIIFLGKKKSDEHYSNEDLNLIMDLAKTEAIAIKNAQLTKEISDASEEKGIEDASLGASHQMKNTLAVIKPPLETIYALITYTDLNTITLEKSKSLISSSKERIAKVLEEIEKGRKIINSILYGDQKEDDAPKEINIYSLVQHSLERSSQAKSQDLVARNIPIPAFINNVPENFPTIVASGVLIGEALINIINNAFDAIIERYVHIKQDSSYKGIIKLSAEDNGKYIKLSIEDNGMGMTEETKKKAFKGLYTTKRASSRGRGAALFFLKKWLKARGGTVSFTSEYGQGTKFTIELPKNQENVNGS